MVSDLSSIQARLSALLPDEATANQVFEHLASSIRQAHEWNPESWSLTASEPDRYLRLNVGRVFAFDVTRAGISVILDDPSVDGQDELAIKRESNGRRGKFRAISSTAWQTFELEELLRRWDELRPLHLRALERAVASARRCPYRAAHTQPVVEALAERLGEELPAPSYPMEGRDVELSRLIEEVKRQYPGWEALDHAEFVHDEITYKREAASIAQELLSQDALAELIEKRDYEDVIRRIKQVGSKTNLLYLGVPRDGDLGVVHADELDAPAFSEAFFDLLWGDGDSPERLGRYLDWVDSTELPSKWTFPTYFLFLTQPESEMFVKPTVTAGVLGLLDVDTVLGSRPTVSLYESVRDLSHQLLEQLRAYGAVDMIDVQSVMWVAHVQAKSRALSDQRRREFESLFQEFLHDYPDTEAGQKHRGLLVSSRVAARDGYEQIRKAAEEGQDFTDLVLAKLLPHVDTEPNRERGAWVSIAQAISKDIRALHEAAGIRSGEDWPDVAKELWRFVTRVVEEPKELADACEVFDASRYTAGLKTGMVTPILNALAPAEFLVWNSKSMKVVNLLTGSKLSSELTTYPEANELERRLIGELESTLESETDASFSAADLFDTFCHWMVAIKKYNFGEQYWKIAPGEDAWQWDECRDDGFIGVGWEELGDVSGLDRAGFIELRDRVMAEKRGEGGWSKVGTDQVWKFSRIKVGDRVIANRGTTEVLGIGVVAGPYYFATGLKNPHRVAVDWDDLDARRVARGGWRRALIKLDRQTFEEILEAPVEQGAEPPPVEPDGDSPFNQTAFELLAKLEQDPRREVYAEHKTAFSEALELPFQKFFLNLASELPVDARQLLETEKRLFSRIPKNDWGRGGAWPFYWAAVYPKGSKRTEDAQLWLSMDHQSVEYGFGFGAYGGEPVERFTANLARHKAALLELLGLGLGREDFLFIEKGEESSESPGWREWLRNYEAHSTGVRVVVPREEALKAGAGVLKEQIADAFHGWLPLMVLSISDEPMSLLEEFIEDKASERPIQPNYPLAQFADETGFGKDLLGSWIRAIERKKQVVFYGPPGTGKTFVAERMARHLVSGTDGMWELVQFHPSYGYEDFMQGIRPRRTADGGLTYDMVKGRFLDFCARARQTEAPCVLVVDEINRANLARVFGELMYLLEYRAAKIPLAGSGVGFDIPANVRLIGTMNTADRSIALVDHALRRRFAFLEIQPNYEVLRNYHEGQGTDISIDGLIVTLQRLNKEIGDPNYSVGITYFLHPSLESEIAEIWRMEIEPYVRELFFDRLERASAFEWDRVAATILAS